MDQQQALNLMLSRCNVFLTGAPGTGKSYVINKFVSEAKAKGLKVALTASTGIAASLFDGTTIHSWSGLGIREIIDPAFIKVIQSNFVLMDRLKSTDCLVIDEISMLSGLFLDNLNYILKIARRNEEPFGGIQVILSGDFFQLPPVSKLAYSPYCFESSAWNELTLRVCYLTHQHRQKKDNLHEILTAMRECRLNVAHVNLLLQRQNLPHGDVTKLLSHNVDVDKINQEYLAKINTKEHHFSLLKVGDINMADRLAKSILAPEDLYLKKGSKVMFVANDFNQGFVNGSQGEVIGFKNNLPLVQLLDRQQSILVEAHSWKYIIDDEVKAEVLQIPLRLAWAMTIHKSQGMSLEEAEIDLRKSFSYGMGYVAISRLRSYDGLYLSGINSRSLQLNKKIYKFDQSLIIADRQKCFHQYVDSLISDKQMMELRILLESGANKEYIKLLLDLDENGFNQGLERLKNLNT